MKKIKCWFFGHEYKLLRTINSTTRELICTRCNAKFGMNDAAKAIVPLDDELIELHKELLAQKQ